MTLPSGSAQGCDSCRRAFRCAEDCAACHEHIRAAARQLADCAQIDAAIYTEFNRLTERVNGCAHLCHFAQHVRDQTLTAEARIDRHDQDALNIRQNLADHLVWSVRIERDACLHAKTVNVLHCPMQMRRRFHMHSQHICACLSESV